MAAETATQLGVDGLTVLRSGPTASSVCAATATTTAGTEYLTEYLAALRA